MRVIIGLILLTISFSTLGQNYGAMIGEIRSDTTKAKQRFEYIENVRTNDTLCINAIRKAERQAEDSLCFVIWNGPFGRRLRYENELNMLSKKYRLKFAYDWSSDVLYENQTEGCYKDFMDKRVYEKFGVDFKRRLHAGADSLFLVTHINDTIISWDCDKEPVFSDKRIGSNGIDVGVNLPIKERCKEWISKGQKMFAVYRPFMDIQFTVDKNGHVSTFKLLHFISETDGNSAYKEQLWALAKKEIQEKYSKWTPATIRGMNVNSHHVIRVQFKNAT